jgi:hypothetical protein
MKALYSVSQTVPAARVIREHRTALIPLGIVLAINIVVLIAVVLPLSRSVTSNEERATAALHAQQSAEAGFRQAEAEREGKSRATADLDTFYRQVLPADVAAARRIADVKVQQLARRHDVRYDKGSTNSTPIRDSTLEQLKTSATLAGDYENVRAFIYELETAPDFVVIENLVLAEGTDAGAPLALELELSTFYRTPRLPEPRSGSTPSDRSGTGPSTAGQGVLGAGLR